MWPRFILTRYPEILSKWLGGCGTIELELVLWISKKGQRKTNRYKENRGARYGLGIGCCATRVCGSTRINDQDNTTWVPAEAWYSSYGQPTAARNRYATPAARSNHFSSIMHDRVRRSFHADGPWAVAYHVTSLRTLRLFHHFSRYFRSYMYWHFSETAGKVGQAHWSLQQWRCRGCWRW